MSFRFAFVRTNKLSPFTGSLVSLILVTILCFPFSIADTASIKALQTVSSSHRRYSYLYTPPSYEKNEPMPLVMVFHGYLGSAEQMMRMTEFNQVAEKEGFLVVYPEAQREKWHANLGKSEASDVDVKFVNDLLAQVKRERAVDPRRIYATGFSSGGFFSQRLACEMPDDFASVATVSATIGVPEMQSCHPKRPVPFLTINGTSDPIITWDGRIRKVRYAFKDAIITSVPTDVRFWGAANQCHKVSIADIKGKIETGPKVTRNLYRQCSQGADVEQIIIRNGGHTWPGSKVNFRLAKHVLGYTSQDVNASQAIWEFFKAHPMPSPEMDATQDLNGKNHDMVW